MKKLTHPKGDGIGGKAAGIEALESLVARGVFKELLLDMCKDTRYRKADVIHPFVPKTSVLCSGHFQSYIGQDRISSAIQCKDPLGIADAILKTPIQDSKTFNAAKRILESTSGPLAIRSSASCEDGTVRSPFAGDFDTAFIVSNPEIAIETRIEAFLKAVRFVYSSFFCNKVQTKMHAFDINPDHHTMSVLVQNIVGTGLLHNSDLVLT